MDQRVIATALTVRCPPGLEHRVQQLQSLDHALGEETFHTLLPENPLLYLGVESGVVAADRAEVAHPCSRRSRQRRENKLHYEVVAFALIRDWALAFHHELA